MVTASERDVLPELPVADSRRRGAPRRADSLPQPSASVTHSDSAARMQFAQSFASKVLAGDSLLYARPVSLADMWGGHQQAAAHYNAWLAKWPRYAWGAFHTALTAVLYALVWVAESPPRLAVAVGVVLGCWFWS